MPSTDAQYQFLVPILSTEATIITNRLDFRLFSLPLTV
jgi:hypothetical protein